MIYIIDRLGINVEAMKIYIQRIPGVYLISWIFLVNLLFGSGWVRKLNRKSKLCSIVNQYNFYEMILDLVIFQNRNKIFFITNFKGALNFYFLKVNSKSLFFSINFLF